MGASVHTDADLRMAIQELHRRHAYVADPHTAIAYLGAKRCLEAGAPHVVFLSTAHPAKFGDVVEDAIGQPVEVPAPLAAAMRRPRQVEHMPPSLERLAALL
jgi:threonine synthase